jgi:hypothetical protein
MPSADQAPTKSSHSIDAMARVGCPDRRIDRLCFTCCSPSQTSHHAGCPARSRLRRQRDGLPVTVALGHHGPGHSGKLVGKRDGGDLGRSPGQQCREPGAVFGAVDLGIADDGECTGHEQAAQIAVTLFADAARSSAASERARSRPRSCVLIGRSWGQQHWRPERLPASDRLRECNEGACSFRWSGARP